jgi:LmbE family N-acetylglucosaminyl deacetylase
VASPTSSKRIICIGAHPDDCEIEFGGTAAKLATDGHAVKFLSATTGDAGHYALRGPELAARRAAESREAARRLGIAATESRPNHDGEILPTLEMRNQIVRQIRAWRADVVLTHRPFDYHPDHRYTGQLVQDSAYLVLVPNICPDTPALTQNPIYLYLEDNFQRPVPFRPDLVVAVDDVWETKLCAMDAHESQFYEWLPWIDGKLDAVPKSKQERREWLARERTSPIPDPVRQKLVERYGPEIGQTVVRAEAFELCEYGTQPAPEELNRLFPL